MNKITLVILITLIITSSCSLNNTKNTNKVKQTHSHPCILQVGSLIEGHFVDQVEYTINIKEKRFLEMELEQKGVDLKIALFSPTEKCLIDIDNIKGVKGKELFWYTFDKPGNYIIKVLSPVKKRLSGDYTLKANLKVPSENDNKCFEMQQLIIKAEKLRNSGEKNLIEEAEKIYLDALSFYKLLHIKEKEVEMLAMIALVEFERDNKEKSIKYYQTALEIAKNIKSDYWIAKIYNGIGDIYFVEKNLEVAQLHFEKGLELRKQLGDISGESESTNNLGSVEWYKGENQKALDLYQKSLDLIKMTDDKIMQGIINHNIGSIQDLLGEHEKAIYYYEKGLELQKGVSFGEAHALIMLGRAHNSLKDTEKALLYYEKALVLANQLGNDGIKAVIFQHMGAILLNSSEYKKAIEYYSKSISLAVISGDITAEAICKMGLGKINTKLKNYDIAIEEFNAALKLIRKAKDIETELNIIYEIANTQYVMGKMKESEINIKKAIEVIENNRIKFDTPEMKSAYFATKTDYYNFYILILMEQFSRTNDIVYSQKALELNEKLHARNLTDELGESNLNIVEIDKNLILKEQKAKKLLAMEVERQATLINSNYSEKEIIRSKNKVIDLKDQLINIQSLIRKTNLKLQDFQPPKPLKIKDIQNLLDKNTLLLSYHLGKEKAYVWAITSKSIDTKFIGDSFKIISLAKEVHSALSARAIQVDFEDEETRNIRIEQADNKYPKLLGNLGELILSPVSALIESYRKIVVVNDNVLNYIPFGALVEPKFVSHEYSPLILTHTITIIPSASTISLIRERNIKKQKKFPRSVAIFADPMFSPKDPRVVKDIDNKNNLNEMVVDNNLDHAFEKTGFARDTYLIRLPFTRNEAIEIQKIVPQFNSKLGDEANLDELMKINANETDILHIASHGLFNTIDPELSGIVFSLVDKRGQKRHGFLTTKDVVGLRVPRIVVLSACSTALGKDIAGEGTVGLHYAFMCAGAEIVVASLWNVNDQATSELMKELYKNLIIDKKSMSESLQLAQSSIFRNKKWKNPYYWASFIVQGEFN